MVKSFLPLACLLVSFSIHAQKAPELVKGNIYSDSKWSYVNSVFGEDESGYYTFSDLKFRERLEKYDRNFNKLITVKLELNDDKYKVREEDVIFYSHGKIFVVSSSRDKKSKINSFFIETLNKNTLSPNNDVIKLCEFPQANSDISSVTLSEDQSKVLIVNAINPEANGHEQFGTCVYDCNISNILYTEKIIFPFDEKNTVFIESYPANTGNAYLYFNVYPEDAGKSGRVSPYKGHLLCITNSGKDKNNVEIPMQEKKPGISKVIENPAGEVIIAGFYSNDTLGNISGCYSAKIDKTSGKFMPIKTKDLPGIKKSTKVDRLMLLKDGSYLMMGEATNHYHRANAARDWSMGHPTTYNDPVNPITGNRDPTSSTIRDMATTSNSYFNGDIIVVKFDNNGEVLWNKQIRKNQFFTVPGEYGFAYFMYASYGVALTSDRLHLVFNDHINNVQKKDEKLTDEFQRKVKSALIDVSINLSDGSYTKEVIQKSEDNKVLFRPAGSKQVSENELVMFGSNEDDHQGMIIKF